MSIADDLLSDILEGDLSTAQGAAADTDPGLKGRKGRKPAPLLGSRGANDGRTGAKIGRTGERDDGDSPQISPDSPRVSPEGTRAVVGDSPNSPF